MTKADMPEVREAYAKVKARFKRRKIDLRLVSAATGEGVRELLQDLYAIVLETRPVKSKAPPKKRARAR
jgi:GTP-binding protein